MEITKEEIAASVVETGEIAVSEVLDFDVVVVGAGGAGLTASVLAYRQRAGRQNWVLRLRFCKRN